MISIQQHIFPSRKPRVILISPVFSLGSVQSVLAQFSGWLCSLVVALPHKELGRLGGLLLSLGDGGVSDGVNLTSTIVIVPLSPGSTHRFTHLKTLLLCNVIPTRKSLESLSHLTSLSIAGNLQPSVHPGYEHKISDFSGLSPRMPRLHLQLSGIGQSIYV